MRFRRRRTVPPAFVLGLAASLVLPLLTDSPATAAAPPTEIAAPAPVSLDPAHWIWYPEGDPRTSAPAEYRYFRKSFTVPAGQVSEAQLVVTGDNTVDVWLNGRPIAASARVTDSWRKAVYVDLQSALISGTNTIAFAVKNESVGPAGVIGHVHVVTSGAPTDVVTDGTWKAGLNIATGWEQNGFGDGGWPAATDLGAYGTAPWNTGVAAPDTTTASALSVASATTEHRTNPLGVDARRPSFGWKLVNSSGQVRQAAYQLQVSSSDRETADVWDSGRVASGQQVDIPYGGPALASLKRYHWRVRVWDTQGRGGEWSAPQWFETGLTSPTTEWGADFIGQPTVDMNLAGAAWIWYPEGNASSGVPAGTRYFRRTFSLSALPSNATLVVAGDDTADVWVNGQLVSSSPRADSSWQRAAVLDLRSVLTSGVNTIAVSSTNTSASPAGMIAKLLVAGGPTILTDAGWKSSQSASAGWNTPGFNDSGWPAAQVAALAGGGPWSTRVTSVRTSPLLRKGFSVDRPVASARLLTTALGLHETRLNGDRVGDEVLAPGWTDYNKRLDYREYDVSAQVHQGENVLGAWLGNGWYSGSLGIAGSQKYGTQPWYSAQLIVTFTDGTSRVVKTDGTWRMAGSPIQSDDLYGGEAYDARLETRGWDTPGFDDSRWAAVSVRTGATPNLEAQVDDGGRVQQDLRPVSVTQAKPGVWVFDMGQNFSGWDRISIPGPRGTSVSVRHAEMLNGGDGTLYTTNLRAAQATDRIVLAGTGAAEVFEPRFTVHGYRYVELTGLPEGFTPTADTVTGRAMWTSGAESGTFTSSNAMLNQVQHNIVWGERSNMLSVPTDCPQRDERLGWTGDAAAFSATGTFNLDLQGFFNKYADALGDGQRPSGEYPDVAPNVTDGAGNAGWADAGVIIPYTLWQRYGDLRVVDEHYAEMARWVEYMRSSSIGLIRSQSPYSDWLNVGDETPKNVMGTAYFAWSTRLLSRMAAATGRTADAARYGQLADQVSAAFTNAFVAPDGTVANNTQTGYVLAVAFGLVPSNRVQQLVDKLAAKVASRNGHLSVGFVGVENLLPVLVNNGHADTAYQILMQPDYPGWGYMINKGATTIWERWDGIRNDGSFQDPGMNSFNHYGLGSVGDFLYRQVGGLGPAAPGYESLLIAPRPGGGLTSASSTYETPYGKAVSDWSIASGRLTLKVTVPAGTTATVKVPTSQPASVTVPSQAVPSGPATYYLPAGSYTISAAA